MRLKRYFIKSVALILVITALLKILTLVSLGSKLNIADPLFFFLSNRILITLAVIIELAVAGFLVARADCKIQLFLIFWLSCLFLLYHIGLWMSGYKYTCYCAGTAFSWEVILPINGMFVIRFLLGYMLVGSGFFIIRGLHAPIVK